MLTNSTDPDLYHPELWWHYTVVFCIPNLITIWSLATDKNNIVSKLLTCKPLIFIGNLSIWLF